MAFLGIERRRTGTALLSFGVIGTVLAGVIAVGLFFTAVTARDLADRLEADQARLAATLEELATSTAAVVASLENAGGTLDTSSAAVLNARNVLDELAAASDALADGLEISILGRQPFAGAADRFRTFSDRVRVFRDDATSIADSIATNSEDMTALAARVAAMETQLNDYAERVAESTRIGDVGGLVAASALLGGLLAAWLAVAAGACAWVGWRLRSP